MNNILQMLGMIKNPQQFTQQILSNSQITQNPIGRNAIEMYQKGDMQGLNQLVDNLCKEKGVTRQEMEQQIRSQFKF